MLYQVTTPFSDGSHEVSDTLKASAQVLHRIKSWARHQASKGSAVADLIDREIEILETDVDALSLNIGLSNARCLPLFLRDDLEKIKARIVDLGELVEFYHDNQEPGQTGALNALYASEFILGNRKRARLPRARPNEGGLTQTITTFVEGVGKFIMDKASGVPPAEAIQASEKHMTSTVRCLSQFLEARGPRYVHKYGNTNDIPYTRNLSGRVAKGSFGAVMKVKHNQTSEELAMKTFFSKDNSAIRREIGVLEVCDHPNIVELVEAFTVVDEDEENDGVINMILRPWAPYTLERFLTTSDAQRKAQCPWFDPRSVQSTLCIYQIMQQLACGVQYLHKLSIKHKDIKPDNILLHEPKSTDIRPLITDVGVSKVFVRGGSTNFDDCSYSFLAPEQVARSDSSLRADVWQLGCCFALILGVSKRGRAGRNELWDSFCKTKEHRSCQIASEHEHFMKSLKDICDDGLEAVNDEMAYDLVSGMLDKDPESRLDIHQVVSCLDGLVDYMKEVANGDMEMTDF
ncbi:serine/threonine protein kinase [Fusarium austroafricanum]|uniref:non-specific serine/threonine protein kinase n=1 Tax=Fusarium austroafricanum TaxID=2364996 RepID=A0A8H4KKZ7_9HYPO|nr:serine/threonine protein kinase [Fusarium austroafricanum]